MAKVCMVERDKKRAKAGQKIRRQAREAESDHQGSKRSC